MEGGRVNAAPCWPSLLLSLHRAPPSLPTAADATKGANLLDLLCHRREQSLLLRILHSARMTSLLSGGRL